MARHDAASAIWLATLIFCLRVFWLYLVPLTTIFFILLKNLDDSKPLLGKWLEITMSNQFWVAVVEGWNPKMSPRVPRPHLDFFGVAPQGKGKKKSKSKSEWGTGGGEGGGNICRTPPSNQPTWNFMSVFVVTFFSASPFRMRKATIADVKQKNAGCLTTIISPQRIPYGLFRTFTYGDPNSYTPQV